MNSIVLCDFDGTITTVDTAEWILRKFAAGDWHELDAQFEKGQVTLEECLNRQFSLVNISKEKILQELADIVVFRQNFKKLAEYCRENKIPLIVVSAGLDFVINHFLEMNGCSDLVQVCAARTTFDSKNVKFTFPLLWDKKSDNIKDDLVRFYKSRNKTVIYIGDGLADFAAAKKADYSFAIKGSRLANLCKEHQIPCTTITDFKEIIEVLPKIVKESAYANDEQTK